jgi:nucleoid-associated protein YgaU
MKTRHIVSALLAGTALAGFALGANAQADAYEGTDPEVQKQRTLTPDAQPDPDTRPGAAREPGETPPVGADRPSQGERAMDSRMPSASEGEYVVEKGDTLAEIAESRLGDAKQWRQIAQLNDIDDPKRLEVGTRLRIPSGAGMDERAKTGEDPAPPAGTR